MAAGEKLKIDIRRKRILEILHRDGQVQVSQLANLLGTTTVTIRSDLNTLSLDGHLERVQGGAVQSANNYYQLDFQRRKQENYLKKKRIASLTANLIPDNATIFLNSGTTTFYVSAALKRRKNLQVVTNSFSIATELGGCPGFRVILLGGDINAQYGFTYGPDAQAQLGQYRAGYAILSIDGVSLANGLSTYHAEEAVIDRLMIERAHETILVAHSGKIERDGFSFVSDIRCVNRLVTDASADRTMVAEMRKRGVSVVYR